jgi:hypothetical protein
MDCVCFKVEYGGLVFLILMQFPVEVRVYNEK